MVAKRAPSGRELSGQCDDRSIDLDELRERALTVVAQDERAILGITGPPGAGKTTLAAALVAALAADLSVDVVAHAPMDGFHLADIQLDRLGLRDRKGAPETFDHAGYAAALERLHTSNDTVYVPGFERELEQPIAAAIAVLPSVRLVVTEGNYLLRPDLSWPRARRALAEVWYCELDDTVRLERLIARHVEFGKSPAEATAWVEASDEPNARLIEQTRDGADLVIPMS